MAGLEESQPNFRQSLSGRQDDTLETMRPTRIIVMPGARMVATERGTWRFPHVAPTKTNTDASSSATELSAGTSKMRALERIYARHKAQHPNERILILVTGGMETETASRSDEAANQLTSKYELNGGDVVSLGGEGQTIGNAEVVARYLKQHKKTLGSISEIEIVENEYKLLRAWLQFSATLLALTTGKKLSVSENDRKDVHNILYAENTTGADDVESHMSKTNAVMTHLQKYFDVPGMIRVTPIVVEEKLERDTNDQLSHKQPYINEYVARIRRHPEVLARLQGEKQGVMDFVNEDYKRVPRKK